MLTRLYIDNFRCFVNFEYKPGSKQLLLGANGSGKSSLLAAIRFLKQFVKGEANGFTQSTRTRWQDRSLQVFELDAVLDGKEYQYRVEIKFSADTRDSLVSVERLSCGSTTVFEMADAEIRFFAGHGAPTVVPLETNKSALHLSLLSNADVRRFVEWVESIVCLRIDAYQDVMDESADREDREPDDELENLAGWYRHLVQAYPVENVKFLGAMQEVLAGFQSLRFSSEEDGKRRLRVDFSGPGKAKVSYSISELSEGQRCLIALYMILHFRISQGRTVFIDEPDNFVALREIQPWLLAAEEATEDNRAQLILISHHPEILNQWATSYGLHFYREKNGHVRISEFKAGPGSDLQPSELIARGWEE